MKRNISYIHMDSNFESWLIEKLVKDPPDSSCTADMLSGLQDVLNGSVSSLLLGAADEKDAFSNTDYQSDKIVIGELELHPKNHKTLLNGKEVNLTPKEFDILYFLVQNRGEVFTKEQIYNAVWQGDYLMDDSNIMAFIRKIRKKIEPNPDEPKFIITIWGIGYKFNENLR